MFKKQYFKSALTFGAIIAAIVLLAGCERPDPEETTTVLPTQTPLPVNTPIPQPTQAPVQVYVVIAQPTRDPNQTMAENQAPIVVTATPEIEEAEPTREIVVESQVSPEATPLPEGYFLGWAWSESLVAVNNLVTVDQGGIILRDRPSQDGRSVAIVMGFADVVIVGAEKCGYEPVIVHEINMLSRTTPQLEVQSPEPRPTELPPFFPTPVPQGDTTSGWAYTDELTILGQTAISGPLGVNLRADPCYGGKNLGFIPAGTDLIVLGLPNGEYTPVRVENSAIQAPYNPLVLPAGQPDF